MIRQSFAERLAVQGVTGVVELATAKEKGVENTYEIESSRQTRAHRRAWKPINNLY